MGWPLVLTDQSQDDLRTIVVFIARDNPEAARSFGNQLIDQALLIGKFPKFSKSRMTSTHGCWSALARSLRPYTSKVWQSFRNPNRSSRNSGLAWPAPCLKAKPPLHPRKHPLRS